MKKVLSVVFVLFFSAPTLVAQQFHIEKSVEFDEPEYGWNKLLQLKNGNTFFFHSTKKDGIEVTVYNKQRKQIASRTLESNLWDISKMKQSKIVGLYEINGEPVIFIVQADDREPTLYRMRINPNTGAKLNEAKLGNLPKIGAFAGYALAFGNVDAPDIIVEKDPNSNCYAVIYFDGFAHESNERIKVVHYDGTHKVLNTAFYDSPGGKFKYLRYIGSVVDSDKRVFIATYGYNGKADQDTDPSVIVSRINAGEKKFTHTLIKVSDDFNDTKSVMIYNHNTNKLQLLTVSYAKSGNIDWGGVVWSSVGFDYYKKKELSCITLLNYIDPESLKLNSTKPVYGVKIDDYGKQNIDKDYEYDGVPLDMVLNKDNTTTVLLEDVTNTTSRRNMGGGVGVTSHKTLLGPAGISELSESGDELSGYAINKKQQAEGTLPVLYMAGRSKGLFAYPTSAAHKSNNNEFLSYDYIYTDKGHYVIFNDLPANADKDEDEEKRKTVSSVSKTNTMCYKLNNPKMDKFYLFGDPAENSSTFCYIESSDYNKDLNTYATMIVERDGRDKEAKIAWVTFE